MKIKVNQYYQGWNTGEQLIAAGLYDVGDPALFGIEDYLVNDQGKAEYVDDGEPTPTEEPSDPTPSEEAKPSKRKKAE